MKLWINLLEASIAGGMCILAFYIVFSLFEVRYRTSYKRIVWLMIIFRLMLPIDIVGIPHLFTAEIPNVILNEFGAENLQATEKGYFNQDLDIKDRDGKIARKSITIGNIFVLIWICGVVAFLLYFFIAHFLIYRKLLDRSKDYQDEVLKKIIDKVVLSLGLKKEPQIRLLMNADASPFTMGIVNQIIFLPERSYDESDIEYIMKHELIHCRRKDVLKKAIILVVNAVHWFNPLVWIMRILIDQDMELLCDEEVLKGATKEEREEYSEIIMSCIETTSKRKVTLSTGYVYGTRFIKRRFKNIFDFEYKKNGNAVIFGCLFILVLTSGIVQIKEGKVSHIKKISIDSGHEIRTDLDGDGGIEKIHVIDNRSETNAFTQVTAQFQDGYDTFFDYPGYWASYLVSGDLSGNGRADIVVMRVDIGSTYGGGNVSVLSFEEGKWKEYPSKFIKNLSLNMEQPLDFKEDNFDVSCLGASIIEVENRTMLRLILNEDIGNDIVKCIDCSYRKDGWYIENIQIVFNYYVNDKAQELLKNNLIFN